MSIFFKCSFLFITFYSFLSCTNSSFSEVNISKESDLEGCLKSLVSDSLVLETKLRNDTLFLSISSLPDFRTNEEYNRILMAYTYYESQQLALASDVTNTFISIRHSYNDLFYTGVYNQKNARALLADFNNETYLSITKLLLSSVDDRQFAYYNLSMNEAKSLFPKVKMSENLYSLLSKYSFKDDEKIYTREESALLDLELKLFYWVSQFPFGELSFDRYVLHDAFFFLKIKEYKNWDQKNVTDEYEKILSLYN